MVYTSDSELNLLRYICILRSTKMDEGEGPPIWGGIPVRNQTQYFARREREEREGRELWRGVQNGTIRSQDVTPEGRRLMYLIQWPPTSDLEWIWQNTRQHARRDLQEARLHQVRGRPGRQHGVDVAVHGVPDQAAAVGRFWRDGRPELENLLVPDRPSRTAHLERRDAARFVRDTQELRRPFERRSPLLALRESLHTEGGNKPRRTKRSVKARHTK